MSDIPPIRAWLKPMSAFGTALLALPPRFLRGHTRCVLCLLLLLMPFLTGISRFVSPVTAQEDPSVSGQKKEETYREFLERRAQTGTPENRIIALKTLGRIGSPASLPVLKTVLQERTGTEKDLALDALAEIRTEKALKVLRATVFEGSPRHAKKAALLLSEWPPSRSIPIFLRGLSSDQSSARKASVRGLLEQTGFRFSYVPEDEPSDRTSAIETWKNWWKRNRNRSPEEWWKQALIRSDVTAVEQVQAVEQIQVRRIANACGELITLLGAKEELLRDAAIRALQTITLRSFQFKPDAPLQKRRSAIQKWQNWWQENGNRPRFRWLLQILKNGSVEEQRRAADELGRDPNPEATGHLIDLVDAGTDDQVRAATRALREITGFSFREHDEPARAWTSWWDRVESPHPQDWYIEMLKNGSTPGNRTTAASHFATGSRKEELSSLINQGLTDPDPGVRKAAIEALIRRTGRTFRYKPGMSEPKRQESVRRWRQWFQTNHK